MSVRSPKGIFLEHGRSGRFFHACAGGCENLGDFKTRRLPPLRIDAGMAQIVMDIMERNFAPVVDDRNKFVGIVTRRDVLRYLSDSYFRVNDTL